MTEPPSDMDRLGRVIRTRREARNWTVYRLAKRSNVSPPYLTEIEEGRSKRAGIQVVARLAQALGITTDRLLIEAGLMDAPSDGIARLPLDVYLRETSPLRDDDIHAVTHLVRRLSENAARYETEDEDEKSRQLRRAGESIEEYRTRTAGNPDAETDADRAAYKGEIPPAPDDHGQA